MAADTLGSYGSLARFRDVERICVVGESTLVGASGDISDFAYIKHKLEDIVCVVPCQLLHPANHCCRRRRRHSSPRNHPSVHAQHNFSRVCNCSHCTSSTLLYSKHPHYTCILTCSPTLPCPYFLTRTHFLAHTSSIPLARAARRTPSGTTVTRSSPCRCTRA
jgi:hypothetical protein